MSQKKLTPWFPGDVKPTRKGVYELEALPAPYHYFDGKNWSVAGASPKQYSIGKWKSLPTCDKVGCTYHLRRRWRGLASDPAKRAVRGGK